MSAKDLLLQLVSKPEMQEDPAEWAQVDAQDELSVLENVAC